MKTPSALKQINYRIRITAILEGISYLLLLFIAMPLKYLANMPEAVKYTGWIHGILFILFMWAIATGYLKLKWPLKKAVKAFIASLLPFGTFVFDKELKRDAETL